MEDYPNKLSLLCYKLNANQLRPKTKGTCISIQLSTLGMANKEAAPRLPKIAASFSSLNLRIRFRPTSLPVEFLKTGIRRPNDLPMYTITYAQRTKSPH